MRSCNILDEDFFTAKSAMFHENQKSLTRSHETSEEVGTAKKSIETSLFLQWFSVPLWSEHVTNPYTFDACG